MKISICAPLMLESVEIATIQFCAILRPEQIIDTLPSLECGGLPVDPPENSVTLGWPITL